MPRSIAVPAQTVREEVRAIEEVPSSFNAPGVIRVQIGRVDERGQFIVPQTFETYEIRGKQFDALIGPASPDWAPGKPEGTYRNEDLWYQVDRIRETMARQAQMQREIEALN
jgi:hypothetical protein